MAMMDLERPPASDACMRALAENTCEHILPRLVERPAAARGVGMMCVWCCLLHLCFLARGQHKHVRDY